MSSKVLLPSTSNLTSHAQKFTSPPNDKIMTDCIRLVVIKARNQEEMPMMGDESAFAKRVAITQCEAMVDKQDK